MITKLFTRNAERRSWRGTGTLGSPEPDLIEALSSGRSSAGVAVTEETALCLPAVWRAVNLISASVAKLPLWVYRRSGENRERALEHPACYILRYQPNPEMGDYFFRYALTAAYLLSGNGYAMIERRRGAPAALWPLLSQRTWPERRGGVLFYKTVGADGREYTFQAQDIFHLRGLGDGILGLSVIAKARETFGSALAMTEYTGRFYSNSAEPSAVLEHPGELGPEGIENLRRSWLEMHQGVKRSHLPAVLEEGMQLKAYGLSNRDAEFLASKKYVSLTEVSQWFGLPPHKLGDTERASYNSLEQENQSFLDDCLDGHLRAWEVEAWDKLLTEREKRAMTHWVEFVRAALLRSDLEARGAYYSKAIEGGWMSRDEVRALENLNPIPGGAGAEFTRPLNWGPAGAEKEPEEPAGAREAQAAQLLRSGALAAVSDASARMVRRVTNQARRAARRGAKDWPRFIEGLKEQNLRPISDAFAPAGALLAVEAEVLAHRLLAAVESDLRALGEPEAASLEQQVEALCRRLEGELSPKFALEVIDGNER